MKHTGKPSMRVLDKELVVTKIKAQIDNNAGPNGPVLIGYKCKQAGDDILPAERFSIPVLVTEDGTLYHLDKADIKWLLREAFTDEILIFEPIGVPEYAMINKQETLHNRAMNADTPVEFAKVEPAIGKFMQNELVEKADTDKMQLFQCPTDGHMHFRHAGYILPMTPYVDKQETKTMAQQVAVMICIRCKHAYAYWDGKMHDVSAHVDLEAWTKTEVRAHKQTGPGGQC